MNSLAFRQAALGCLILILTTMSLPALAMPSGFAQAVRAYNERRYSSALAAFQQIAQSSPSDIQSHYYMAMCYQSLNQLSLARQQYQWVAAYSRDPALKARSASALSALDRHNSNSLRHNQSTSPIAQTAPQTATQASTPPPKPRFSGRPRIYYFFTNSCHVCQTFNPVWEKVTAKFRTVDFQKLDAQDDSNAGPVGQFSVNRYPTLVFSDSSGKVYRRIEGAGDEPTFTNDIKAFIGE